MYVELSMLMTLIWAEIILNRFAPVNLFLFRLCFDTQITRRFGCRYFFPYGERVRMIRMAIAIDLLSAIFDECDCYK